MRNILIEAHCIWGGSETEQNLVPQCCIKGPNNISINCLKYNGHINQYCPYLIFGTARSSMVLANQSGDVINSDVFWADLSLPEQEWIEKEGEWVEKQNFYISKQADRE